MNDKSNTEQFILERALDGDGINVPADAAFPAQIVAELKAARRDEYRSVLLITPSEYLASLDDERWQW